MLKYKKIGKLESRYKIINNEITIFTSAAWKGKIRFEKMQYPPISLRVNPDFQHI